MQIGEGARTHSHLLHNINVRLMLSICPFQSNPYQNFFVVTQVRRIEPELNLPTVVLLVFVVPRTSPPPGPGLWFTGKEKVDRT